jgi:glycosyltransferase involved in cell wall biosynthesis
VDKAVKMPLISVILPVYNAAPYLKEAIESILNQSFTDFELLVIDDASTDNSVSIIKSFNDNRIVLFEKSINTGYTDSLIMAVIHSKGKYIARMDADDYSLKERFSTQFNYMESNPNVLVLGTMFKFMDSAVKISHIPLGNKAIKLFALTQSPLAHPTAFIRRRVFDKYNLKYDRKFEPAEDYDLWSRVLDYGEIENLPDVLLYYRRHEKQVSAIQNEKQNQQSNKIRQRQVEKLISFDGKLYTTDFAVRALVKYGWDEITSDDLVKISFLLRDMWEANKLKQVYDDMLFLDFLKSTKAYYIVRLREYKLGNLLPILINPDRTRSLQLPFAFGFILKSIWGLRTKLKK